jgi:3'-phosphoadenosine 5'-phosphosulfate (PAPS) 3'-phosphatase
MLFTAVSFAQNKPDWEKIKSLKVAFITEKLSLSSKEAQEFWPVYNAYEEKREALRKKEHTQIRSKIRDAETLTEKESAQLLKQHLELEEEEEELDKEFLKEVSTVISSKKTLLLLRSEEDFKRQLIKQYRHNKGGK